MARGLHCFMLGRDTILMFNLFSSIFTFTDFIHQKKDLDFLECGRSDDTRNNRSALKEVSKFKDIWEAGLDLAGCNKKVQREAKYFKIYVDLIDQILRFADINKQS